MTGLPKESGRLQIVNIHTKKMYENGKVADDVSREELAAKTKNFSGAEIEGLCRAAAATAMNRLIKVRTMIADRASSVRFSLLEMYS